MNNHKIKIVVIGESGSGKSTMIRHLSQTPDELEWASSSDGQAGKTKVTVEYIFGGFNSIQIDEVKCNLRDLSKNQEFKKFLNEKEIAQKEGDDDYEVQVNRCAKEYLKQKSIKVLFDEINSFNTFMYLSLQIPANEALYKSMQCDGIDLLKVVDTRGLGDKDDIERVIPFGETDAIMIMGKDSPPNPSIRDGLTKVCEKYSFIPVLFVGVHSFDEDGVEISSDSSVSDYLQKVNQYNNSNETLIKTLYADICERHLEIIEPVSKAMEKCKINHVPRVKSLANPKVVVSKYYKFYQSACIEIFCNCIKTISVYQQAQKNIKKLLNNSEKADPLFQSLCNQETFKKVIEILAVEPKNYDWYVDFLSVAQGWSERNNTPLEYSYNCVSATLRQMLSYSIRSVTFFDNEVGNDIIKFFLSRVVQQHSYNWLLGWDSYHDILNYQWKYEIVTKCKERLKVHGPDLKLDRVVCTRFGEQYDQYTSIKILLYEETLCFLMRDIFSDIYVNRYLDSINNESAN